MGSRLTFTPIVTPELQPARPRSLWTEPASQSGLGDLAQQFFASLGVTEESYRAKKKELGFDPNCNCKERKEWLNRMGEEFGVNRAASRMAEWLSGRSSQP